MLLKKWLPLLLISPLIVAIDQLSQIWVVSNLVRGESRDLIAPYLQITHSTNTGFAFGMGSGSGVLALIIPISISIILFIVYVRSASDSTLTYLALAIIFGGAVGNIIDRLYYGYVIDFVHIIIPNIISNVSNLADHAIVFGVLLLIVDTHLHERRQMIADQLQQNDANDTESQINHPTDYSIRTL